MGKKKNASWSDVEKDLKKYTRNVLYNAAKQVQKELSEEATWAIANFYQDYSPKTYKRHYYNFMDNSFEEYYSNAHGNIYRGGIQFTIDEMDELYNYPVKNVFETVYDGWHGLPGEWSPTEQMSPTPMERILQKQQEIIDNQNKYIEDAKAVAIKDSYITF